MLCLRLQGWPIKELGFLFGVDHTSIRKACLRNGLPPELPLQMRPVIVFRHVILDFDGERINQGKNYQDYIEESRQRKSQLNVPIKRSNIVTK